MDRGKQERNARQKLWIFPVLCFVVVFSISLAILNGPYEIIPFPLKFVNLSTRNRYPPGLHTDTFHSFQSKKTSNINRAILTKAVYPLTLTAPFILTNPHICEGDVTLLIVVKTAGHHDKKRNRIRHTFGSSNLFKTNFQVRIVFMLGTVKDNHTTQSLASENLLYHDIVQGDFIDSYKNLTLKGVLAYRWINNYCSHAQSVIFIDDDIYINVFIFLETFYPRVVHNKTILCNTMYPSEIIRYKFKWQIDHDFFRGQKYYPPYCSGFTVIMNTDIVFALWKAAHFTPVFWVDDVYLTGLLPNKYDITKETIADSICLTSVRCNMDYNSTTPTFVSLLAPKDAQFYFYWNRSLEVLSENMINSINEIFLSGSEKIKKR